MYQVRLIPACISARLTAWLIDAAISIGLMVAVAYRLTGSLSLEGFVLQATYSQLALVTAVPLAAQLIIIAVNGKSLGMDAVDLSLLQDDGQLPTMSNALRRPLGFIALILTLGLSSVVPLFNEQRRTLGDYLSGSRVVEGLALGTKIAYDPWRIFMGILRPMAPISLAIAIAVLLIGTEGGPSKSIFLNAVVLAALGTMLIATLMAAIKVKVTRVRLSPKGIQRSGWFGWSKRIAVWEDLDYARIRIRRLFPYFEIYKHNHSHFRIPLENNSSQLTASTLLQNGVRIEQ